MLSSDVKSSPSLNGKNCVTTSSSSELSTDALGRTRLGRFFGCSTICGSPPTDGSACFGDVGEALGVGKTACSSRCGLCELPDPQKMAIAEIKIKIPAAAATSFQLDQCLALIGIGKTMEETVAAVCARKAASSAASTRAGGSSPAISATTARTQASKARSSASRAAQRSQLSI